MLGAARDRLVEEVDAAAPFIEAARRHVGLAAVANIHFELWAELPP